MPPVPSAPSVPRAVLDACVLYPAPLRDLFMHLAVVGAFQARWTADIHDEWIRSVLADRPDLTLEQLDRTRRLMDTHAEDCLVENYSHRIAGLTLPDPDDRHVLAAAIETGATGIVTLNRRHFPAAALAPYGVTPQRPDDFLCGLYRQNPANVRAAARTQRAFLKKPPKTVGEYLLTLEQNGLTDFAACLRAHANEL